MQVLRIECSWKGMPPFPKENCNYHHKLVGPPRQDIKPLDVVQPEGPSFTVSFACDTALDRGAIYADLLCSVLVLVHCRHAGLVTHLPAEA